MSEPDSEVGMDEAKQVILIALNAFLVGVSDATITREELERMRDRAQGIVEALIVIEKRLEDQKQ